MTEQTELDLAHLAMTQGGDAERLQFYQQLADTYLVIALKREAEGDNISPELFEIGEGRFVLVFDREERLSHFTGTVTPYAGLVGRVLIQMLGGQGIGVALNLEVAPSSILIPGDAVDWLDQTLTQELDQVQTRLVSCLPPTDMPDALHATLTQKLANVPGLANAAWLVNATYDDGTKGRLLGFVDAHPLAEAALAKTTSEALIFADGDSHAGSCALDVGFFALDDPFVVEMARVGKKFHIPEIKAQKPVKPAAPGSDPEKPPILR